MPEVDLGDLSTHQKSWHICFHVFFVMPKQKSKNPFGQDWVTLIAKLKKEAFVGRVFNIITVFNTFR